MKITKLPEYLRQLRNDITQLFKLIEEINYKVVTNAKDFKRLNAELLNARQNLEDDNEQTRRDLDRIRLHNTELEHMLASIKRTPAIVPPSPDSGLFADNHDLDAFYLEFENYFRGDEAEIRKKQEPYIKLFNKAKLNKKLPIVDLGCGRGEFLDLLSKSGYRPLGVDLNEAMVRHAREQKFEALHDDAISYLIKQPSSSLSAITGFHLAEHIPFDKLLLLIAESYRCLAKDGILLLETPNPESLFVGAFTFHYDPSHLKPLPPAILQFAAEFKGFRKAEIMRMQPELTDTEIAKATSNTQLRGVLKRLYGPRDYALVAYK